MHSRYNSFHASIVSGIVIILLWSFMVSHAYAAPVTQERAQEIALEFLLKEQASPPQIVSKRTGKLMMQSQAASLTIGKIQPIKNESDETIAFVQELEPQGFIIASADDVIRPVLGHSFTGNFLFDVNLSNPLLDLIKADVQARKKYAYVDNTTTGSGTSTQWAPWLQISWKCNKKLLPRLRLSDCLSRKEVIAKITLEYLAQL